MRFFIKNMRDTRDPLFTPSFILICLSNLMIFAAFYMLFPVLPIYLMDELKASPALMGVVLSAYTIGTMIIRPIAGFLVDRFPRKTLFCIFAIFFSAMFSGYLMIRILGLIAVLRVLHGFAFGLMTTTASTLAIDIMPIRRVGMGISIFGVAINIAMAIGPMAGMFILNHASFQTVFTAALGLSILGSVLGFMVKCTNGIPIRKKITFSFNEFFLIKGVHAFAAQAMTGIFWGLMVNFVSVYAREQEISINVGFFFLLLAAGAILSRCGTGSLIDRGHTCALIVIGTLLVAFSAWMFVFTHQAIVFLCAALGIGLGYGLLTPAYQSLFVRFANADERGKANSTYFIAWDVSIGGSVLMGGTLIQWIGLHNTYLSSVCLLFASVIYFMGFVYPMMIREKKF